MEYPRKLANILYIIFGISRIYDFLRMRKFLISFQNIQMILFRESTDK